LSDCEELVGGLFGGDDVSDLCQEY